ncbi:unnamed protein product [Agarophyton chilense]
MHHRKTETIMESFAFLSETFLSKAETVYGTVHNYFQRLEYDDESLSVNVNNETELPDDSLDPLKSEMNPSWGLRFVDRDDRFSDFIQHHTPDGSIYRGPPITGIHLTSVTAVEGDILDPECFHQRLRLPSEICQIHRFAASYYKSLYPFRKLSPTPCNDLSTDHISTSFFSEKISMPVSFKANLYQACVLKFFEEYESGTYLQIRRIPLASNNVHEESKQENIRVRQALLSLSTELAPVLIRTRVKKDARFSFRLNDRWNPYASSIDLASMYRDLYISSLDRRQERRIRRLVEIEILKTFSKDQRTAQNREAPIPVEYLVETTMNQNIHDSLSVPYVQMCLKGLVDRGEVDISRMEFLAHSISSDSSDDFEQNVVYVYRPRHSVFDILVSDSDDYEDNYSSSSGTSEAPTSEAPLSDDHEQKVIAMYRPWRSIYYR